MVYPTKYFRFPFGNAGTLLAIPDTVQGDGSVSYPEGFGPDYALDPATQPAALNIPRDKSNQLYNDITKALQFLQQGHFPYWIDNATNGGVAFSYDLNAFTLYTDGVIYQSLVAANTTVPGTDPTKWEAVGQASVQNQASCYATDTGAANAYVVTLLPAPVAYKGGQVVRFIPANANTTGSTINVNALGVKSIVHPDGSALLKGDIPTGGIVEIVYQATIGKFVLMTTATNLYSAGASSGYCRIPGTPYIFQWGTTSATTGVTPSPGVALYIGIQTVNFPVTFPNGCIFASCTPIDVAVRGGEASFIGGMGSTTQLVVYLSCDNASQAMAGFYWVLGY